MKKRIFDHTVFHLPCDSGLCNRTFVTWRMAFAPYKKFSGSKEKGEKRKNSMDRKINIPVRGGK